MSKLSHYGISISVGIILSLIALVVIDIFREILTGNSIIT